MRELRPALLDDTSVEEDVDEVGLDVIEDPLVVRDQQRAHVRRDERLDALGDNTQRVDVEAGVGLVEHRDPGLEHRHLQDLHALLLAAREAVVDVPRRELSRNLQPVHRRQQLIAELGDRNRVVLAARARLADRIDGAAQEVRHRDAGNGVRVLEREKQPALRPLVGAGLREVLAVEEDLALGDLVRRVAHQGIRQRRLARAVRAHDGVHLVRVDREVDALDDLRPVLQRHVEVPQFE